MKQKERGMIDIPIGKALVAVERKRQRCQDCVFFIHGGYCRGRLYLVCEADDRQDGKNVIFKLVDFPSEENNRGHADEFAAGSGEVKL